MIHGVLKMLADCQKAAGYIKILSSPPQPRPPTSFMLLGVRHGSGDCSNVLRFCSQERGSEIYFNGNWN